MGDVVLRKGKEKKNEEEKSQSQQPPSVLDGLDHGNSQQEGSDEATKAEQPSLCTVALCQLCDRRWFHTLPPK